MSRPNGIFITLEGGEGAGKSTQISLLQAFLVSKGVEVVVTREPGGSEGAESIRELLVKGDAKRWDPETEALLMNAARRDHVKNTIRPALNRGAWVICDRFADSTRAYQGFGHGMCSETLEHIIYLACGTTRPDLTFVFDIPPEIGLRRAGVRDNGDDRFEQMSLAFHQRVYEGFQNLAERDKQRCIKIDAQQSIEGLSQIIQQHCQDRFFQ